MKSTLFYPWLALIIAGIIVVGGLIFIIHFPVPPEPPCIACSQNIKLLGIAEIVLGGLSLGLVIRLRNLGAQNRG